MSEQTKKSVKRRIGWVVLVCAMVLIGIVVVLLLSLNGIIRRTVVSQSEQQLDLPAQLADADLSLFGGTLRLSDYRIGSPQGFQAPAMFSVGALDVGVSYNDLRQDPVRIKQIAIQQPTLVIEYGTGKFNYQILVENAARHQEDADESEPVRMIIDQLTIDQAMVVLRLAGLKDQPLAGAIDLSRLDIRDEYRLTLPKLDMRNIGTGDGAENGAAIREVVMQVVTALTAAAAESEDLPKELRMVLSGNLEDIMGAVGEEARRQLNKALEDVGGETGKILQGVIKGIDGEGDPSKAIEEGLQRGIQEGIGGLLDGRKKQESEDRTPAQTPGE